MKNKATGILLAVLFLTPFFVHAEDDLAEGQVSDQIIESRLKFPGSTEGTGRYFEINDSKYRNVSLSSNEEISIKMKSVSEMVVIEIEPSSGASSAELSISGLVSGFTYHKYEDNYHNHTELTANESGSISFSQDATQRHIIFIQSKKSTKFIKDDATGGDCSKIGSWDGASKTCRLNQDLYETTEIDNDNITLDGNGHTLTGKDTGSGIYVLGKNVTVKNLTVSHFDYGIYLSEVNGANLNNVVVKNNLYAGIEADYSSDLIFSDVVATENEYYGLMVYDSGNITVSNSVFNSNDSGICQYDANNSKFENNEVSGNRTVGLESYEGEYSTFKNNKISSNVYYGMLVSGEHNTLSGNKLSENATDASAEGHGFYISSNDMEANDVDKSNTIEGKSIYYEKNISNKTYDGASERIGAFYCLNCNNITIKNATLSSYAPQVFLWNTDNSLVENVGSPDKSAELVLINSDNNTIRYNDFDLIYKIKSSLNNKVYANNFWHTYSPVYLYSEDSTSFYLDLPIGGNYWKKNEANCSDADNDGFCDAQFKVYRRIYDKYPRISPNEGKWEEEPEKAGNSNILFIPGIQASRLYEKDWLGEDQLWEPTGRNEDVNELYLDKNGNSVKSGIYTKDIMDEAYKSPYGIGNGFNIYKSFISFMDKMKTEGTIADWSPLPYDWRYSPEKVIQDGIVMADGSIVDPVAKLEALASSAKNGKVTIISHSNGGIFAKLLVSKLKEQGKQDLVDKIIFVATPQMGTPKTLAGLLHGDKLNMASGVILDKATARGFAENMASAYNLLPTKKYFEVVETPVIEFTDEVKDTYDFRSYYGESVNNFDEMKSFLLGDNGKRTEPVFSDTDSPNVLSEYLLGKTETLHNEIDNWQAPEGMKIIQIAGWGLDTIAGIEYDNCDMIFCDGLENLDRKLNVKSDGDGTVVTASAVMMNNDDYYLNLKKYNRFGGFQINRDHANILEVDSLQEFIKNLIQGKNEITEYITEEKPEVSNEDKRLRLRMHSPVDVHLSDNEGRHTGLIENPNPDSDIKMYEEEIPNSYYWEFGETKYLGVGTEEATKVNLEGTGTGTFTFEIDEVSGTNETITNTTFSDIPVFEGMKADLNIDNGVAGTMSVDLEGDGKSDFSITPGDDKMKSKVSLEILDKILSNLTCHKSVKQPLTQRMIQVKKLYSQNKITPANNLLEAMINHLEAVEKRSDLNKLGISKEEMQILIDIISKVKLNN